MKTILIDVGSSTIKVYSRVGDELKSIMQKSIPFKEGFDSEKGISESSKNALFDLIDSVKKQNEGVMIRIYATGIFRKLNSAAKILFIDEFFERTGIFFNIISQELENFYLEMALISKCILDKPILLMNIGGGSTELVVMNGKYSVERLNIDLGVGNINTKFPELSEEISKIELKTVIDYVKDSLPEFKNKPIIAFYTGGELNYMQLAGYALEKNNLFNDADHPSVISFSNFVNKNQEIFTKISIKELELLMPENPMWMHGARACSAIAQAITEKYGIETIIPSNSNLINGVVRSEN
jgi:exopolyphosphatase/pppGpp-phosphohydrolase